MDKLLRGGRARRVLHAGADEEEPARDAVTVVAPPGAARGADRRASSARRRRSGCGTRRWSASRLDREMVTVDTPSAPVRFKVARRDGAVLNAAPEFDDCARARRRRAGVPVKDVQAAGATQALGLESAHGPLVTRCASSDDRDRLREQPAAPRHGVREDHAPTSSPATSALPASRRAFVMGNDEHSQNVFKRARESGRGSAGVLRPDGAGVPRRLAAPRHLVRRLHPDDRAAPPRRRAAARRSAAATRATSTRASTRAGTASAARRSSRRRISSTALCPIHLTKPEWIHEKNYFFRLSKYQQPLLDHFAAHPEFIAARGPPQRDPAPASRAASRTSRSAAPGSRGAFRCRSIPASVVYVWFDALINYASAVGYGTDDALFAQWWPADLHVIGKDITRFHCVIWPAMLMSAGLALPRQVFGHGWVYFKGERMSKSLGTVVDPLDAADRFGADPLRLYLVEGDPVRRRRRLLVGALRGDATTSTSRTISATSSAA